MKNALIVIVAAVLLGGGYYLYAGKDAGTASETGQNASGEAVAAPEGAAVVPAGQYAVVTGESSFNWSAKKPLIDGYVNSGTIALSKGTISVTDTSASGSFTLDMNTLDVGLTAKKPGKEGALEGHLKSADFFDVEKYPTATFVIQDVEATAESSATFTYRVTGDLTMKGKTNEVSFPAQIYMKDGKLMAKASFEIDRTDWGLTYGSGNFFQDLGNNLIDDMVSISFDLVAEPR